MTFQEKHKKGLRILILCYIVFAGCFSFPIHSEQFKINFMRGYLFVAEYGIIGTSLAGICGTNKGRFVYISTLAFTIIGLACRYLLEFGEVSNTYNFTLANIIAYLLIIPIAVLIVYLISVRVIEDKEA